MWVAHRLTLYNTPSLNWKSFTTMPTTSSAGTGSTNGEALIQAYAIYDCSTHSRCTRHSSALSAAQNRKCSPVSLSDKVLARPRHDVSQAGGHTPRKCSSHPAMVCANDSPTASTCTPAFIAVMLSSVASWHTTHAASHATL